MDDLLLSPSELGAVARRSIIPELAPASLETPADTGARVERAQIFKANALSKAGLPAWRDPDGLVQPVTDESGERLTNLDARHSIAYDSTGAPRKVGYDEGGAPVLSDPFADAAVVSKKDPSTGTYHLYKSTAGLPWQWQGEDTQRNAVEQAKETRAATNAAAAALGRQLSSDEHEIVKGSALVKAAKKRLLSDVPMDPLLLGEDPKSVEGDPAMVHAAIDQHFNDEYASPSANEKKHWYGPDLSDSATALRAELDKRKAWAHARAEQLFSTQEQVNSKVALREQRLATENQLRQQQLRDAARKAGLTIPGLDDLPDSPDETAEPQPIGQPTPPQPDGPSTFSSGTPGTSAQAPNERRSEGSFPSGQPTASVPAGLEIPGLDTAHAAQRDAAEGRVVAPPHETGVSSPANLPKPEGAGASFLRPLASGIVPALGTAAGGTLGAAAGGAAGLDTGPGAIATAIVGDIAGGAVGGALARKAQDAVMGKEWTEENQRQLDANMKEHPTASKIGAFVPAVLSMLGGGGGTTIKNAVEGYLARIVRPGATPGFIQKAIAALPETMTLGARMGTAAAAQNLAEGKGSYTDLLTEGAKGALTMGPVAFVPGASSLLGAAFGKAPADAAVLATANALYDRAVTGTPIDYDQLKTDIGTDIPGFMLFNLLSGLTHGHPLMARRGEPPSAPGAPAEPSTPSPPPEPAAPSTPERVPNEAPTSEAETTSTPAEITPPHIQPEKTPAEGGPLPETAPVVEAQPEPVEVPAGMTNLGDAFARAEAQKASGQTADSQVPLAGSPEPLAVPETADVASRESAPIPASGTPEFDALPIRSKMAALEHRINQQIIDTGKHPNGSKATAAQLADLRARQPEVLKNYEHERDNPRDPNAPQIPGIDTPATRKPKTYEEAQSRIDEIENRLESQGANVFRLADPTEPGSKILLESKEWSPMPPDLASAYADRNAIGAKQFEQSRSEISTALSRVGLTDGEIARVLNHYGINPKNSDAASQSIASEHTAKIAAQDPIRQAESVAYALAAERGERFDELRDVNQKTLRDAANAVKTVREVLGVKSQPTALANEVPESHIIPGIDAPPKKRVQLKSGPQTYTIEEALPAQKGDQPGERYFRVRNERTGAEQVVEKNDIKTPKLGVLPSQPNAAESAPKDAARSEPQTPAAQVEQIAANAAERKAAERLAKAPDTAPAKMKVQKEYLLSALDKAHEDAKTARTPQWHTAEGSDDQTQVGQVTRSDGEIGKRRPHEITWGSEEEKAASKAAVAAWEKEASAALAPLFRKYDIPTKQEPFAGYKNAEGGMSQEFGGKELNFSERETLLSNAIAARDSDAAPRIEIEVPGDGTFRIVNTKEAIAAFRKTVEKEFPTRGPAGPKAPTEQRKTPTKIPELGKPRGAGDLVRIAGAAVSDDPSRAVLANVYSDGKNVVATNGRWLMAIEGKAGGTAEKPAHFNPKTLANDRKPGNYPNWKQVVPDSSAKFKNTFEVDTASMLKLLHQANELVDEKSNSVKILRAKNGEVVVSANNPDVGEFVGGGDPDGATPISAFNPQFLIDALNAARQMGHEKVIFKTPDAQSALLIEAPKMKAVIMPMRMHASFVDLSIKPDTQPNSHGSLDIQTRGQHFRLQSPTGDAAGAENPGGESGRSGDFAPTQRSLDTLREHSGSRDKADAHLARLKIVKHFVSAEEAPGGMAMTWDGRLLWSQEKVKDRLLSIPEKYRFELMRAIEMEEMAHRAHDLSEWKSARQSRIVFHHLPEEMKQLVRDAYQSGKDDATLGAEYIRMLTMTREGLPIPEEFYRDVSKLKAELEKPQSPTAESIAKRVGELLMRGTPKEDSENVTRHADAVEPHHSELQARTRDGAFRAEHDDFRTNHAAWRDLYDKTAKEVEAAGHEWNARKLRDTIAGQHDAVENVANYEGGKVRSKIRLDFPEAQDDIAARVVIEAGGSLKELQADRAKVASGKDPKRNKEWLPIFDHAIANFTRLDALRANHDAVMADSHARLKAAGEDVGEVKDYVRRITLPPSGVADDLPRGLFEMGNGMGRNPKNITKERAFAKIADAVHEGYDPGAKMRLSDLDASRVELGERIIERKKFLREVRATPAPRDGKPIIGELEERNTLAYQQRLGDWVMDGSKGTPPKPEMGTPKGYTIVQTPGGGPLPIHNDFAPLFKALFGQSALRQSVVGRGLLKGAAALKTIGLAGDTYHIGRVLYKMAIGGGGRNIENGRALIEYDPADLARAVKAGEVTQEQADYADANRANFQRLLRHGLNVGRAADNLYEQAHLHLPGIGKLNDWIFNKLSRAAMAQTALRYLETNLAKPEFKGNAPAAYRQTAIEANEAFGNLGSQGIFKSKTIQDLARVIFLAPQWVESQARNEFRAYAQAGKTAINALRGQGLHVGNATRAFAIGGVAMLAANQVINYLTRGHSTFENEEEGHQLDAFIPFGKRGGWFNPLEIVAENAHMAMRYAAMHDNPVDIATHIASNKLSSIGRAAKEGLTGRDYAGRPFLTNSDRATAVASDLLPLPISAGGLFEKDPRAATGYRVNRQPGSVTKQALQSFGLKVANAQSPRSQIFALAKPFRADRGGSDSAGEYTELRRALDNDDMNAARKEIEWLQAHGKTADTIKHAVGIAKDGSIHPELFTGGADREKAMLATLTPKERDIYQQAQRDHRANALKLARILPSIHFKPRSLAGLPH